MTEQYFVIMGGDGEPTVSVFTKESLLAEMNNMGLLDGYSPLAAISEENINYWPENSYLIIKGSIVVPKPVEIVTEWDI